MDGSKLSALAALTGANLAAGDLFYVADVSAGLSKSIRKDELAIGLAGGTFQPLDGDLTALAALTGTNNIYYRSAADTWTSVTIGSNLTFSGGTLSATGGGSGANPTASVGLSAVNGSAGTFLRSDGAPALSQAIAPTWTAAHVFAPGVDGTVPWTTQVHAAADHAYEIKYTDGSVKGYWDFTWGHVVASTYGLHSLGVLTLSATAANISYRGTYHAFADAGGAGENVDIYGGTGAAQCLLADPSANGMQGIIIGGRSGVTAPGVMLQLQRVSSTTAYRQMADIDAVWATSTDASRKARLLLNAWDTAAREGIRVEASGTVAMLGFYGSTAVVKPATTGTSTGFTANSGTAVNDASTFTGGTGSTAYRISDIVLALKQLGLLAA